MTKTKNVSTMRVGDIIVDEMYRKIGVSRMEAEVKGGSFQVSASVRMNLDELTDGAKLPEIKTINVGIHSEFADFSVWRTDLKPEDLVHFLRAGDFFIVPSDEMVSDAELAIRAVERVKNLIKDMGVLDGHAATHLLDEAGRYASWLREKETRS
jgi:hypothetical protein